MKSYFEDGLIPRDYRRDRKPESCSIALCQAAAIEGFENDVQVAGLNARSSVLYRQDYVIAIKSRCTPRLIWLNLSDEYRTALSTRLRTMIVKAVLSR